MSFATWDGRGVQFDIFSAHATAAWVCLFDRAGDAQEATRIPLERHGRSWRVQVPGIGPGQVYGFRFDGPWDPAAGHRFNPAKILLDPYALALGRPLFWDPSLWDSPDPSAVAPIREERDDAAYAPLAMVVADEFDWAGDRPPRRPWRDTVIYEAHVKGATALHPGVDDTQCGTYLGLAAEPVIRHLTELGVTAVELLPVHQHADEWPLVRRGLRNYWGYSTLGYFMPDARFATGGRPDRARDEFRTMVRALHAAGIEVILDVVFNHTAEGDHLGPALSFRGIDNLSYYRLDPSRPGRYLDATGTGNTVNVDTPEVRALVLDSLRFWVHDMHVDGFRFDLATTLARGPRGVAWPAPLSEAIAADPLLSTVKFIAEPWDIATDGYQLGRFPAGWSEWNNRYRDTVRRFWRGDPGQLPDLATRLAGSSDVFAAARGPLASLNFVTSHDGFTLADLVSHGRKHNEANGEQNRDGEHENFSWNHGVEGATTEPAVLERRARDCRNLLLTLFVSQGVPMISGGDEVGRSQRGNNNAYCQDSPLSWTPWSAGADHELAAFVRGLTALRRAVPAFRRDRFFDGREDARAEVQWLGPDGREMTVTDWHDRERRAVAMVIGHSAPEAAVLLNAGESSVVFTLPPGSGWEEAVNTTRPDDSRRALDGTTVTLGPRSAAVLVTWGPSHQDKYDRYDG